MPQSPHVHGIPELDKPQAGGADCCPGSSTRRNDFGAVLFDRVQLGAGLGSLPARRDEATPAVGSAVAERARTRRSQSGPGLPTSRSPRLGHGLHQPPRTITGVETETSESTAWIAADLVVDAGGKGSTGQPGRKPRDSSSRGDQVNGFVGHAIRWLRVPDDSWPGRSGTSVSSRCPRHEGRDPLPTGQRPLRHVAVRPRQGLSPADDDAFLAFLERCATPLLHEVVAQSEP